MRRGGIRWTIAGRASTRARWMILVDTNILARVAQAGHRHRQPALDAMERLRVKEGEQFAVAPQSLYELYVVCTRPTDVNGLGMTAEQGRAELAGVRRVFPLVEESAGV